MIGSCNGTVLGLIPENFKSNFMEDQKYNPGEPLSFLQSVTIGEWQRIRSNLKGLDVDIEENMNYEAGKEEEFVEWLQLKTGKSRTEIIHILPQVINKLLKDRKDGSPEPDDERLYKEQ